MTTFCILCREPIPEDRQRRGACTCSSACQKELRRQRRNSRGERFCRLCGRKAKANRKADVSEVVPTEHSETISTVNPSTLVTTGQRTQPNEEKKL